MSVDALCVRQLVKSVTKDWCIFRARQKGMSVSQIARELGWSESTVRRSIQRTLSWQARDKKIDGSGTMATGL